MASDVFAWFGNVLESLFKTAEYASDAADHFGKAARLREAQKLLPTLRGLDAMGRGAELLEKYHEGETFCGYCESWFPKAEPSCPHCGATE